jgi:hypothetical protein
MARFGVRIDHQILDLVHPDLAVLLSRIQAFGEPTDLFLIAGFSDPQENDGVSDSELIRLVAVNFLGPIRILNLISQFPSLQNVVGLGSIAA